MNIFKCFSIILLIISPLSWSLPKVTVTFNKTAAGFTQVKIRNETLESLACFVAIDGFQKKFQLRAKSSTQWITATDTRYNYQNFSTWCDYLDVHPKYKAYVSYPIF
jgi:hypothetical protein